MRLFLLFWMIIMVNSTWAQSDPVQWSFESKKINATEYDLVFTAQVNKGWFIYSQYLESNEGPIPTSFEFEENEKVEFVGEIKEEGHKKEGFDDIFGMNLIKFSDQVTFTQRIRLKGKLNKIDGSLEFMTCDDERCLPPLTVEFEIELK